MPSYRYWQLEAVTVARGYLGMAEMYMFDDVNGANLITSGMLSATSALTAVTALVNGNLTDYYVSDLAPTPHKVTVDFTTARDIKRIDIYPRLDGFPNDAPSEWKLNGSTDNVTYTTVQTFTVPAYSPFGGAHKFYLTGHHPSGTGGTAYAFWKVTLLTNGGVVNAAEWQMRTSAGGANAMTGGTLTVRDATFGAAANMLDGNPATFWGSNQFTGGVWLKYAFASAVNIAEMLYRTRDAGYAPSQTSVMAVDIQVSNDDVTYTTVDFFYRAASSWAQATDYLFTVGLAGLDPSAIRMSRVALHILTRLAAVTASRRRFTGIIG